MSVAWLNLSRKFNEIAASCSKISYDIGSVLPRDSAIFGKQNYKFFLYKFKSDKYWMICVHIQMNLPSRFRSASASLAIFRHPRSYGQTSPGLALFSLAMFSQWMAWNSVKMEIAEVKEAVVQLQDMLKRLCNTEW